MNDLKRKTVKGILWSTLEQWSYHTLNTLAFVVFARLLGPEDFGTWGIAVIYIGFAAIPINFGLREAVIQQQNITQNQLASVFSFQVLACLGVVVFTLLVAPSIAEILHIPQLSAVLQLCTIIIACDGLCFLQECLFQKEFNFRIGALRRFFGMLVGAFIGISAALLGAGIWSLVLFHCCGSITRFIVIWTATRWRPSLEFDWFAASPVYAYGRKVLVPNLMYRIKSQSDRILIGALLGHSALGYYTFALKICTILHELVSASLSQVVLPLFSRLQDDIPKARRAYLRLLHAGCLVGVPAFLGALATAPLFIPLFFGEEWNAVIPLFQLLALSGAIQTFLYRTPAILSALGHLHTQFKLAAINCVLAIPFLWIGASHSLIGAAIMFCLLTWILWLITEAYLRKILGYSRKDYIQAVARPFLASFFMLLFLMAGIRNLSLTPTWLVLLSSITAGFILYALMIFAGNYHRMTGEIRNFRSQFSNPEIRP